jgi:hypothetical protein
MLICRFMIVLCVELKQGRCLFSHELIRNIYFDGDRI